MPFYTHPPPLCVHKCVWKLSRQSAHNRMFPSVTLIHISLRKWGLSCQRKRESFTGSDRNWCREEHCHLNCEPLWFCYWTHRKHITFLLCSAARLIFTSTAVFVLKFCWKFCHFCGNLKEKSIFEITFKFTLCARNFLFSVCPAVGCDVIMMMSLLMVLKANDAVHGYRTDLHRDKNKALLF